MTNRLGHCRFVILLASEKGAVRMISQEEKGNRFRRLHERAGVFVIPNPWDVASARVLTGMGFEALATSSAANKDVTPCRS